MTMRTWKSIYCCRKQKYLQWSSVCDTRVVFLWLYIKPAIAGMLARTKSTLSLQSHPPFSKIQATICQISLLGPNYCETRLDKMVITHCHKEGYV